MKKLLCVLIGILLMLPLCVSVSGAGTEDSMKNKSFYKGIIESEIKYVNSLSCENGAITMSKLSTSSYGTMPDVDGISASVYSKWPSGKVMPYFSEFACLGAIQGDEALGTENAKETVKAFIEWYISHMNTAESDVNGLAGTVYDYYIFVDAKTKQTVEITTYDATAAKYASDPKSNPNDYDSTDSYASLFIRLLYKYNRVYDNTYLEGKSGIVDSLFNVIMGTYIKSLDLTGAKPNYMVAYLMDNCEVYNGLVYASKIYREIYKDETKASEMELYAGKIKDAILTSFWRENDKAFVAGVFEDGKPAYGTSAEDMKVFYPQQTAQLFPVAFGLIDGDDSRAISCYEGFNAEFGLSGVTGHDWVNLSKGDTYPWAIILRAAFNMGDYERCTQYIDNVNKRYIKLNHAYPYYNAEAGHILSVASLLYGIAPEDPESSAEPVSEEESSQEVSSQNPESVEESSKPIDKGNSSAAIWIAAGCAAAVAIAAGVILALRKKKK